MASSGPGPGIGERDGREVADIGSSIVDESRGISDEVGCLRGFISRAILDEPVGWIDICIGGEVVVTG